MLFRSLRQVRRYPSAVVGLGIIGLLVGLSLYAVLAIPYSEALRLWQGGPGVWDENPKNVPPVWVDLFTADRLPRTIVVTSSEGARAIEPVREGVVRHTLIMPFEYQYDGFPTEITMFSQATFEGTRNHYSVFWVAPDGTRTTLAQNRAIRSSDTYYISLDNQLRTRMPQVMGPEVGLFSDLTTVSNPRGDSPVKGTYQLLVETDLPEGYRFETKLVVYGQVHGLAGTDNRRRDLIVPLLWGAPLALLFGLLGAVGANLATFVLAGVGTWYGGRLDALFQRLTQLNMILPLLPILIMVGQFFSRSLWITLGIVILLNIFSASYLTYRAMFLQAKEAPYIEAAQAYGAGNMRIVFRYLLPRIIPVLLPSFVLVVPAFVFLEASLAVLGLGDPLLPTWGKVIFEARTADALYKGYYYWVLEPAFLLMFTGFGFALVGFTLDRVFNPRLRTA